MLLCVDPLSINHTFLCKQCGHNVTVFERNDRVGGLLRYGIPTMKLGKDVSSFYILYSFIHKSDYKNP